ncbi:MAG: malto-oligosyltrehalose trehalohydrolase [Betaproteobacteria bacterium]
MTTRAHAMPFGATPAEGGVRFRLWAPSAWRVDLLLLEAEALPMQPLAGGWYEATIAQADARTRYAYRIDGRLIVPDPASRCNPDGVHGPSLVTDPHAFDWPDADWRGRPWHEAVIYELHVGSFTPQGTFAAAIERLDELAALGVTAIELMPVAAFPGRRNWGYDGVLPFAPAAAYGTPEALKRFVAAAHARGLMVLLDVVYNHFGPDGNYLHAYAQPFFDRTRHTPWGAAIDFGVDAVRAFFVHNALYWLEEFHFDGLRLDAVHAIEDARRPDIVEEIAQAIRAGPGRARHVHLILENDRNEAHYLARDADRRPLCATAQWNDDLHHAAHVLATGETDGYYVDYADDPLADFGRALAEGFVYQGEPSGFRGGRPRGEPSAHLPPAAFVNFLQTHDQVGNRAFGERLVALTDPEKLRALAACVLLAPAPPLLFMGEEWGAGTPFLFFCDFGADLAEAVRNGRRAEFGRMAAFADAAARERIPDPNAVDTFAASRLDWSERERAPHAQWLTFYRELLALRRQRIVPLLAQAGAGRFEIATPGLLHVAWPSGGARLQLDAYLPADDKAAAVAVPLPAGEVIHSTAREDGKLAPWTVRWSLEDAHG